MISPVPTTALAVSESEPRTSPLWRTLSACRVETHLDAQGGSIEPFSVTYRNADPR